MNNLRYFSSESVTEGHPDKLCDYIADSILDACLSVDKNSRVACEVCATTGLVFVMGEITTDGYIEITDIVRKTLLDVGYDNSMLGIDGNTCAVLQSIHEQSRDIKYGVDYSYEYRHGSKDKKNLLGAGDQGMMFGFACDETEEYMPLTITLAHKLSKAITDKRKSGDIPFLRPDGKVQITMAFCNNEPQYIDTIVISVQHDPSVSLLEIEEELKKKVIFDCLDHKFLGSNLKILINPSGSFVVGGPHGDSGLTGRKIIMDTYGSSCRHGGGAFSGKDPTKVDRSAAYYARYVCKNLVAAKACKKISLQVSYAISKASPVALYIKTDPDSCENQIYNIIRKVFDFRLSNIIDSLDLRRPIYKMTSNYGHFGKAYLPWEKLDKIDEIKKLMK